MLGGLDCSKSYFLGLRQKLLSEWSSKSWKLSGFYKLSSGTSTYFGVLLDKCKRGLGKFFRSFESLPFIDNVYGENLRHQKVTFWLSPKQCLLLSSSRRNFGSRLFEKELEVKTSWFFQCSQGRWKGPEPQKFWRTGARSWAFIPESVGWLSSKIPCAKIRTGTLRMTFQATSLRAEV